MTLSKNEKIILFFLILFLCLLLFLISNCSKSCRKEGFIEYADIQQVSPGRIMLTDPNGNLSTYDLGRNNTLVSDINGNISSIPSGNFNSIPVVGRTAVFSDSINSSKGILDSLVTNTSIISNKLCIGNTCITDSDLLRMKTATSGTPIGTIITSLSVTPSGYLPCDGRSLLVESYNKLFNVIGYQFGGSGTNFRIPDLRGRGIIGSGQGTGLSNRTLGQIGGLESVTLTYNQIPSHNHSGTTTTSGDHNHSVNSAGDHVHSYQRSGLWGGGNISSSAGSSWGTNSIWDNTGSSGWHTHTINNSGNHNHTFTTSSEGGGQSHENMSPFYVCNYFIKYEDF